LAYIVQGNQTIQANVCRASCTRVPSVPWCAYVKAAGSARRGRSRVRSARPNLKPVPREHIRRRRQGIVVCVRYLELELLVLHHAMLPRCALFKVHDVYTPPAPLQRLPSGSCHRRRLLVHAMGAQASLLAKPAAQVPARALCSDSSDSQIAASLHPCGLPTRCINPAYVTRTACPS